MDVATPVDIREVIADANNDFMVTFGRGDAAGMADLYTDDGQLLPPNSDFMTGKEAIQAFWQALMDMGIKEAKLDIIEVEEREECDRRPRGHGRRPTPCRSPRAW